MNDKVFYSEGQIRGNIHRTLKANLLTYLPNDILDNLTDKYFRDKEGNLLCAYTGKILDKINNVLELEHIIPVSNGGGTILFNVVPSLKEVNSHSEKGMNNLLDWWKNSEYFDISRLEKLINYMLEGYEYCAKQDGIFTVELEESEEQDAIIKDEEYFDEMQKDVEGKEIIKKHDINTYKLFLNSLIIELENNKIDVSSYLERIKSLEKENVFEELDEQVMYQKVMLSLMRKYANNEKYKISSEVDYKKIIHNLGLDNIKDNFEVKLENFVMTLNEEKKAPINVHKSNEKLVNKMDKNISSFIEKSNKLLEKLKNNKKVKDEDILKYELEKQIIKVFKKTSNKISFDFMMQYIIEYPEILYYDYFNYDRLLKEYYKKYDKYADIIIGFCNEYQKFPSQSGTKDYHGINEAIIYGYYHNHKSKFSKEKQEEIERLINLYQDTSKKKKTEDELEMYADIIIGFCNEHKKFPSGKGTKEYQGISEKTIYGYYNSHKNKFSKENLEEIEGLQDLFESKKYNKYADIIIGFCNEYKKFPREKGTKEYKGISEKTIHRYYRNHKDKFFKEKREEIEGLQDLFESKKYDKYAVVIIGFCNKYQCFPNKIGMKEYNGINEKTIYYYYYKHKDKFSKEKSKEIERLKEEYQIKNGDQFRLSQEEIDNYADIIIGFCNEYQKFPSQSGTKDYHGINEAIIYGYYHNHKSKFLKEKQEEIERLINLYQDTSNKKKTEDELEMYAELIIGFCNMYEKFPSQFGTKEYQGISEKAIYNYYRNHKDKFSKEKREEIERLQDLFESEKYDKYADIIIGFCNEHKKFPSGKGTKEYQGISEKTIYGYYNSHKNNFLKEKCEEIERLKKLYPNKKGRKKVVDIKNITELDSVNDVNLTDETKLKRAS